jgi:hypothetical protein
MMKTYDPFLKEPRYSEFLKGRPVAPPGSALVLHRQGQTLTVIRPTDSSGSMWFRRTRYDLAFQVDIGQHQLEWRFSVPCRGDVFSFGAEIRLLCAVIDPALVVERRIHDPREVLEPRLVQRIRQITRRFEISQSIEAEAAVREAFKHPIHDSGFELDRFDIRLLLDESARRHVAELHKLERESEQKLRAAQLAAQISDQARKEMRSGVEFYTDLLDRGENSIWAIQLTRDPEALTKLIERIMQHDVMREDLLSSVFKKFLDEGDIEPRHVREGLLRLWESMVGRFNPKGVEQSPNGATRAMPGTSESTSDGHGEQAESPTS